VPQTIAFISMSLDGFAAGPDISQQHPLGRNGEILHEWLFAEKGEDDPDARVVDSIFARIGAVVIGNVMFSIGWKEWGEQNPFPVPVWVLAHAQRESIAPESTNPVHFVSDLTTALALSRAQAGDKDLLIGGGPTTIDQVITAGELDEIIVTVAPVLLGNGTRLFASVDADVTRLEPVGETSSVRVTHLHYRFPDRHSGPSA
jgi:dihydrofolate reductase